MINWHHIVLPQNNKAVIQRPDIQNVQPISSTLEISEKFVKYFFFYFFYDLCEFRMASLEDIMIWLAGININIRKWFRTFK